MPQGGANKANQRQSRKRETYYKLQHDKTAVNKLITMARHIVRFNDTKALDRLKQRPAIDKSRASKLAKSPAVKQLLANA